MKARTATIIITRTSVIVASSTIGGLLFTTFVPQLWWLSLIGAGIGLMVGIFLPLDK